MYIVFVYWLTEQRIASEVEPNPSDQGRELSTVPTTRQPLGKERASSGRCECGVELRPLYCCRGWADYTSGTAGHGAGSYWLGYCSGDRTAPSPLSFFPAGPVQPWGGFRSSSAHCLKFPALPPTPASPSARPQPTISTVRVPRVCHPPSSPWLENRSHPPPASACRPSGSTSAPSPPLSPIDPSAPPGSLVPLALPWSAGDLPFSRDSSPLPAPHRCFPPAPLGSFLLSAPPRSSVTLAPPRISVSSLYLRLGRQSPWLHPGPPDPRHPPGSLALRLHLGLLHHLLCRCWSAPWSRQPSLHHCSSLLVPLDYICWPPPGCPSSSCASSLVSASSHLDVATVRGRTFREGVLCQVYGLSCVCYCPHVLHDPASVSQSLSFGSGVSRSFPNCPVFKSPSPFN